MPTSAHKPCAVLHGVRDERFEARKAFVRDAGAHVDTIVLARGVEGGADPKSVDAGLEEGEQLRICGGSGDDAFDADAVLARGLEDAAHEDAGGAGKVAGVIENDGRVFATELEAERC